MSDKPNNVIILGKYLMIRGILTVLGTVATICAISFRLSGYVTWIWIGVGLGGWFFVFGKSQKNLRPSSFSLKLTEVVWIACDVGMNVAIFEMFGKTYYPLFIPYIVAAFTGSGFFICSIIHRFGMLKGFACIWWAGSLGMYIWGTKDIMIFFIGLVLLFEVVLGFRMYRKGFTVP